MNNEKINRWLAVRGLSLEDDFATAFRQLVRDYKIRQGLRTASEVYKLLGVTKQDISYWAKHPERTQTKKFEVQSFEICN